MDYYEFLPDQLKAMLDDISDEEAEAARKEEKTVAQDATVTEEITLRAAEDADGKKAMINVDEHLDKEHQELVAEINEAEDRVKTKMAKLQDVVEQTV